MVILDFEAVAITDLLGGFAGFVSGPDVGDVLGVQEAPEARIRGIPAGPRWVRRCFVDAFSQVSPLFTEVTEVQVSSYYLHFSDYRR